MGDKGKKLKIKKTEDENEKINKDEIKKNSPTHIKFNYSFITNNSRYHYENGSFTDKFKLEFLQRTFALSQKELVHILAYRKNIGIEFLEKEQIIKDVKYNPRFDEVEYRKKESGGKFAVFRIHTNNNPLPSRVIGKLINNVFYIMFIDLEHELYKG